VHHSTTPSNTPQAAQAPRSSGFALAIAGLIACAGLANAQMLDAPDDQPETPISVRGDNTPQQAQTTTPKTKPKSDIREPTITFGMFAEPIELTTLIDYVGSSLKVNIVVKGSPTGEIVFNAPIQVPRSKLINLLDAMLEQFSYTVSYDPDSKFYIVQPITDLKPVFGDKQGSTRIIPTPNIKPSLLVNALNATLGASAPGGGNAKATAIQAVDELGVLIINAPPRDIARVEQMVAELVRLDTDQQYIRFDLNHLAAPTALNRVISLVGGSSNSTNRPNNRINPNNQPGLNNPGGLQGGQGSSLSNLSERLTIDPQGNALIFKGTENEIARVRKVLSVIDVPNTLEPKSYFAGSSAAQIADIAKRRGLGEIIQIQAQQQQNPFNNFGGQNNQFNQQTSNPGQGGPVMVVDIHRGTIIYYGTDDQQAQLAALLKELKTDDERVVIREYVLNHTDAITISELLNSIISGQQQTGNSSLLPGASGRNTNLTFSNGFPINADGESTGAFDPSRITVIADEFSNQIIIKAPIKQQEDLEALITRLDRQRPQVYIQAMIVSIADNQDFTLAFETQLNAGQYSMGTDFGLSGAGATFTDPRTVATGLGGFTAAVIKSQYVPLIINATQGNSEVRILSTPQLLVNNNEESSIVSTEEQPYTQVVAGNGTTGPTSGFGGTVQAGTTLTVTPSISDSGFIRLEYFVELSNFIGTATVDLPPATTRRTVEGTATVPSDATIVIGGITVEDIRNTVIKVPLLGDIPLVGELFKKTSKVNNKSKLYVFLTPRIMTDPNFNDLKLESKGPQNEMGIDSGIPDLEPALIMAPSAIKIISLPPAPSQTSARPTAESSPPMLKPQPIEISNANEQGEQ